MLIRIYSKILVSCTLLVAILVENSLNGLPTDASVVAGSAALSIDEAAGTANITASDGAIVNFNAFNIASSETVNISQPSSNARMLARVVGEGASHIDGTLNANGTLYLVNHDGIYFGDAAVVDVGRLFAIAGSLSDEDFLQGQDLFTDMQGVIENNGYIRGDVIQLIGRHIRNYGSIVTSDEGVVGFAAGDTVIVSENGSKIYIEIPEVKTGIEGQDDPGIVNSGAVQAPQGAVNLSVGDIYAVGLQLGGRISSKSIQVSVENEGIAQISGEVVARDHEIGGAISVSASKVGLSGAKLDVSGALGGGIITMGDPTQSDGTHPEFILIDSKSTLLSDAIVEGDGGTITIWAEGWTRFEGMISAVGKGPESSGGSVEVSGVDSLYFQGDIDVSAFEGQAGTILFDPLNITVWDTTPLLGDGDLPDLSNATRGVIGSWNVSEEALEGLAVNAHVILEATNNIRFADLADDRLDLPMDATGSVSILADSDGNNLGRVYFDDADDVLTTAGADISIQGASLSLGMIDSTGGDIQLTSSGVLLTDTIAIGNVVGGDVTLTTSASVQIHGNISASGDLEINGDSVLSGNRTLSGANVTLDGAVNSDLTARSLIINSNGITSITGNMGLLSPLNSITTDAGGSTTLEGVSIFSLGDISLGDSTTFSNTLAQAVTSTGGEISAGSTLAKGTGNLTMTSLALIDLDASVTVANGLLSLIGSAEVAGDLSASGGISLSDSLVLNGAGNQLVSAGTGILTLSDSIGKAVGDLTLAGQGGVLLGDGISLNSGALTLNHSLSVPGDIITSGDINLLSVTLTGVGAQRIDSTGGAISSQSMTKAVGNLELGASTGIDSDGDILVNLGSLTIEDDLTIGGNLLAGGNLSAIGAITLDDVAAQSISSVSGTTTLSGDITKASGDLSILTPISLDLDGDVTVNSGALTVAAIATIAQDIVVSDSIIWLGSFILDGAGSQTVDVTSGLLSLPSSLVKASGDLTIAADSGVDIDGTLQVSAGSLIISDDFTASGDLIAANSLSLLGNGIFDSAGSQTIDAMGGALTATSSLSKASGNLILGGDSALSLSSNVTVSSGSLQISDGFSLAGNLLGQSGVLLQGDGILDGVIDQSIDGGVAALTAEALSKAQGGLTLSADLGISLNDDIRIDSGGLAISDNVSVSGDIIASDGISWSGTFSLIGLGSQVVDAGIGSLDFTDPLTKASGDLTLGANAGINVDANIQVINGSLTVQDDLAAADDITASANLTLLDTVDLDGLGTQSLEATTGTLSAASVVDKDQGDLTLAAGTLVDLNGAVTVDAGSLTVQDDLAAADDITASANLTLLDTVDLDGLGTQSLEATTGTLSAASVVDKDQGDLTLAAGTLIDLNGAVTVDAGSLTVQDDLAAADDITASANLTLLDTVDLDGLGTQSLEATTGTLSAASVVDKDQGDLTLAAGTLVDLNGAVTVDAGSLTVQDDLAAADDITASANLTLLDTVDLDGLGTQSLEATTGTLSAASVVDKDQGDLTLAAGTLIDLNGAVTVDAGSLTVQDDLAAADDITASANLTLLDTVDLDGLGTQSLEATTGTLSAASVVDKDQGDLTLAAGTLVDLNGAVTVDAGSLTVQDDLAAADDITASANLTLLDTVDLDGLGTQSLEATTGTLSAASVVDKDQGDLTLAAGTLIDLNGAVTVDAGSLTVQDDLAAADDITASANLTLLDTVDLDGLGTQSLEATTGTLSAASVVDKDQGDLTLAAGTLIDLNGAVTVDAGSLTVQDDLAAADDITASANLTLLDTVDLDGLGTQSLEATTGTLSAASVVDKDQGDLTLAAGTLVDLNGAVTVDAGSLTVQDDLAAADDITASANLTLLDTVDLDGLGTQSLEATTGTLSAASVVDKDQGDLTLAAGTLVDLNGAVTVDAGSLTVQDDLAAADDITASANLTLLDTVDLDGLGTQSLEATTGTLSAASVVDKDQGDLTLAAGTLIDLNGAVTVDAGSLTVQDDLAAADDITASANLTLLDTVDLDGLGTQSLEATTGTLSAASVVDKDQGDLTLAAGTLVDLNGAVTVDAGSLTVQDDLAAADDITASANLTLLDTVDLDGLGTQSLEATTGTLSAASVVDKDQGDLTLAAGTLIDLNGAVTVDAGSLTVQDDLAAADDITASANLTLLDTVDLDGLGTQSLEATTGTLSAASVVDKDQGDLTLAAGTLVDLNGAVTVDAGSLTVQDDLAAADDITASANLTLLDTVDLDGLGTQSLNAGGQIAVGAVNKTTAGDLNLSGGSIQLFGGAISNLETLNFSGPISLSGDVILSGNTISVNATLNGSSNLTISALTSAVFNDDVGGTTSVGNGTGPSISLVGAGTTVFLGEVDIVSGLLQSDVAGMVRFEEDLTVTGSGSDLSLLADVTLAGMDINSSVAITIGNGPTDQLNITDDSVTIETTNPGDAVTIFSKVDGGQDIEIATNDGDILIAGDIGASTAIDSLEISGGDVDILGSLDVVDSVRIDSSGQVEAGINTITAAYVDVDAELGINIAVNSPVIEIDTTLGDVEIDSTSAGAVEIGSSNTGGGDITIVLSGGGDLTVEEAFTASGDVSITVNGGDLIAADDPASGVVGSDQGDVFLTTNLGGDIYIGLVSAQNGQVVVSTTGSLQDAQDDLVLDIDSPFVDVSAVGSIGGNPLVGSTIDVLGDVEFLATAEIGSGGEGSVDSGTLSIAAEALANLFNLFSVPGDDNSDSSDNASAGLGAVVSTGGLPAAVAAELLQLALFNNTGASNEVGGLSPLVSLVKLAIPEFQVDVWDYVRRYVVDIATTYEQDFNSRFVREETFIQYLRRAQLGQLGVVYLRGLAYLVSMPGLSEGGREALQTIIGNIRPEGMEESKWADVLEQVREPNMLL